MGMIPIWRSGWIGRLFSKFERVNLNAV